MQIVHSRKQKASTPLATWFCPRSSVSLHPTLILVEVMVKSTLSSSYQYKHTFPFWDLLDSVSYKLLTSRVISPDVSEWELIVCFLLLLLFLFCFWKSVHIGSHGSSLWVKYYIKASCGSLLYGQTAMQINSCGVFSLSDRI